MKIELGIEVKDKVTGFKGIVVGHCAYLTGCDQYLIQPKSDKPGVKPEPHWFDDNRLEVIGKKALDLGGAAVRKNGADLAAPKK